MEKEGFGEEFSICDLIFLSEAIRKWKYSCGAPLFVLAEFGADMYEYSILQLGI